MFKLLSLILTSLTMGSILTNAAPQAAPSASCITCPVLFIPVCSAICPAGDDCLIIPRHSSVDPPPMPADSGKRCKWRTRGQSTLAWDPLLINLKNLNQMLKSLVKALSSEEDLNFFRHFAILVLQGAVSMAQTIPYGGDCNPPCPKGQYCCIPGPVPAFGTPRKP
ncbi:hypothetical protein C8R45DRAFT_1137976 [Mycena sanguinolenta]|nr:hypothetical protein C8R45DRAFT_1137976 [Mycena sanguinolenta]